jgi:hypothetical protein
MTDHLVRNVGMWLGKRPQLGMGIDEVLGANFLKFVTDQPNFILPGFESRTDAGRPGNGHEFPTKRCIERIRHSGYTITEEANSHYAGRLFLRGVGGLVTSAQQGGTAAWKHSARMLDALLSRQLPLTTMIGILGGANFRIADMVVDRSRLEQTRVEVPRYSVDVVGSGKFARPNGVDVQQVETATAAGTVGPSGAGNAIATVTAGVLGSASSRVVSFAVANNDTPTIWAAKARAALAADPVVRLFFVVSGTGTAIVITAKLAAANDATMNLAIGTGTATGITPVVTSTHTTAGAKTLPTTAPDIQCFDGNLSEVFWTDQFGPQQLTGSGCTILNWFIELANNTKLNDRCSGDPAVAIQDGALTTTPSHVRKMKHGDRAVSAQVTVLLDDTIPDWLTYATGDILTDVTFRANGPIIEAPFRHSLARIMPKASIADVGPTEFEGEAALQITLEPFWDDTTDTALIEEVVNTETSNYD